ncbi:uncharacterized protein YraI [Tepidamorphus gemmatus]|uniref:Uncharacterized protein YraI n=1 Tax=Tepidamorphus gemmatus TaxID=747076 RepID=A0A4R3MLI1_9HYPH|nr:SH3 domain-containing protein [Tepidamorphus gemmatus]TCT13658.1 uncharacterized protein YraI [Tepidamorphus gemmatus]
MRTEMLALAAFAGALAMSSAAEAANGFTTGNVNMRSCGSTQCRVITTIPAGAPVEIYGCTQGYRWCDTRYGGLRGWVSGSYLRAIAPGYATPSPLPTIGALLGIAIIGGAIAGSYYDDYPYYRYGYYYPGWRPPYPGWRPPYPGWRPPYHGGVPAYPGRPRFGGVPIRPGGGLPAWNAPLGGGGVPGGR